MEMEAVHAIQDGWVLTVTNLTATLAQRIPHVSLQMNVFVNLAGRERTVMSLSVHLVAMVFALHQVYVNVIHLGLVLNAINHPAAPALGMEIASMLTLVNVLMVGLVINVKLPFVTLA